MCPDSGQPLAVGKQAHRTVPQLSHYVVVDDARLRQQRCSTRDGAKRLDEFLRIRNDLYCVGWGVKLYSLTHFSRANSTDSERTTAETGTHAMKSKSKLE